MQNAIIVNFAGGEVAPKARGRFDIASYNSSCRKMVNFIPEVQGPAKFRPGFQKKYMTCAGVEARLFPYEYSDSIFFQLEFANGKVRVYKNGELVVGREVADIQIVDSISKASQAVVTLAAGATNFTNGDHIKFERKTTTTENFGMTEVLGKIFLVSDVSGLTFKLKDSVTGAYVDSSAFTAYNAQGHFAKRVYEVTSPYNTAALEYLVYTQTAEFGLIISPSHVMRSVHLDSDGELTITTFLTNQNLFSEGTDSGSAINITDTDSQNPCRVDIDAADYGNLDDGDLVYIASVVGTTELNGQIFQVKKVLLNPVGPVYAYDLYVPGTNFTVPIDGTSFTGYTSGGTIQVKVAVSDATFASAGEPPLSAAFHESRLVFGGTTARPSTIFASRTPDDYGNLRHNDFIGGANDDDAYFFTISPVNDRSSYISWLRASVKGLLVGSLSGVHKMTGATANEPITPTSINIRQVDSYGSSYGKIPVLIGSDFFFIEKGGKGLRALAYDYTVEELKGYNAALSATHVFGPGLKKIAYQQSTPSIIWALRTDGILYGLVFERQENVFAWFRVKIAGTDAEVVDISVIADDDESEQLWIVSKRNIDGTDLYFVEKLAGEVVFPDLEDFYTGKANATADRENYLNAVYALQDEYVHMDGAHTHERSDGWLGLGTVTLTPGAVTGTGVTFTAYGDDVFSEDDVGKEIWKKPKSTDGSGTGKAVITAVNSTVSATATITEDFDSTDAIPAGQWFITTDEVTELWDLEGENVSVVADGAVIADGGLSGDYTTKIVTNGAITLPAQAAVVHVGLPYEGLLQTLNLELGGRSGPAQDKPRHVHGFAIRFLDTLGAQYGTGIYRLENALFEASDTFPERVAPAYTGVKRMHYPDEWEEEKNVVIMQRLPLPCTVQYIDIFFDTGDE